jgi:hypothetical protein
MSFIQKSLFSCVMSVCALSGLARANDTSYATIEVDSIDTDTKVGSYMSFKGEEARKLMTVLPKLSIAGEPEPSSRVSVLGIKSPGYEIKINCSDLKYVDSKRVTVTPNCKISFNTRNDDGDTTTFIPEKQCN